MPDLRSYGECPHCKNEFQMPSKPELLVPAKEDRPMQPGDFGLCSTCGEICVVNADMKIQAATVPEFLALIEDDPKGARALDKAHRMIRRAYDQENAITDAAKTTIGKAIAEFTERLHAKDPSLQQWVLIPADGTPTTFRDETREPTLLEMQEMLKGYAELVSVPRRKDVQFFCNEEGRLHGMTPNPVATLLIRSLQPNWQGIDFVGPVVVLVGNQVTWK